jgi:hypothetical protein
MSSEMFKSRGEARTCIVSLRKINRLAAWCSNYEYEDVIATVDQADRYDLTPSTRFREVEWLVRRLYWRTGARNIAEHLNPGLETIALKKDYELFVFICGKPSDLIYLNAVNNWKDRCKRKICIIVELWASMVDQYAFHLRALRDFDTVILNFTGALKSLEGQLGRPCHHVPLGADVLRFSPYPTPPARVIDVFSMGRRSEAAHSTLLKMAARRELFYIYDTIPGLLVQPRDHVEHRDMIANCGKRSRFFVSYPAKVGCDNETKGQSEVGARFFEAAATGAVMIGQAPTNPVFRRDFSWPDALVDLPESEENIRELIAASRRDFDRFDRIGRLNAKNALLGFDWAYRWRETLGLAGASSTEHLAKRVQELESLATAVVV